MQETFRIHPALFRQISRKETVQRMALFQFIADRRKGFPVMFLLDQGHTVGQGKAAFHQPDETFKIQCVNQGLPPPDPD